MYSELDFNWNLKKVPSAAKRDGFLVYFQQVGSFLWALHHWLWYNRHQLVRTLIRDDFYFSRNFFVKVFVAWFPHLLMIIRDIWRSVRISLGICAKLDESESGQMVTEKLSFIPIVPQSTVNWSLGAVHILRQLGEGVGKCWPLLTKGGEGVSQKLTIADMLHMVACMVADKVAGGVTDKKNIGWHGVWHGGRQRGSQVGRHGGWSRGLVDWAQTFSTRTLPADLRVFLAL